MRREYALGGLRRSDLAPDPIAQLGLWLAQAAESGIREPSAMVLSTVDGRGWPSQRTVLLKGLSLEGLVFFTNLESAKAQHIQMNNGVSLHFPWHELERQVRVTGLAERLDEQAVIEYFASRPRGSQLGAWASNQSEPVPSRAYLEQQLAEVEARFEGASVPVPPAWGGYRVVPESFEFWQGRPNRLHDRFQYNRLGDEPAQWQIQRLAP